MVAGNKKTGGGRSNRALEHLTGPTAPCHTPQFFSVGRLELISTSMRQSEPPKFTNFKILSTYHSIHLNSIDIEIGLYLIRVVACDQGHCVAAFIDEVEV